nr:hypothetical protein [uncultured Desulfuromonas sp.]
MIPVLLLFLAALLTIYLRRVLRTGENNETVPQLKNVLVPPSDQTLLIQLEQILDASCRVLWHVSLKNLLRIGCGSDWGEPDKLAQLNDREFTCVVCDRDSFTLLAVIDFCPNHEPPAVSVDELVPGLEMPILTVAEMDCELGHLRSLLLARFPELELRLSSSLSVSPKNSSQSVFSSL